MAVFLTTTNERLISLERPFEGGETICPTLADSMGKRPRRALTDTKLFAQLDTGYTLRSRNHEIHGQQEVTVTDLAVFQCRAGSDREERLIELAEM